MREYAEDEAVDFVVVGTGAGGGPLIAGLAEAGFSVIGFDAGPYFRPLEDFASDETEQNKLYWTDNRIVDRQSADHGRQEQRQVGGRLDSPFRHGVAALPARVVQVQERARLWGRLAARLAGHVGLVRQGGARAQHLRPDPYPWGPKRPAIPTARTRSTAPAICWRGVARRWGSTGRRRRWPRFGAPRQIAALRLSRLLPVRVFDQRQAEPAGHLHSQGAQGWRRDPRPRHGRADRNRTQRAGDGRPLHPRRPMAFPKGQNVVVAGYAIETPRLLLASADAQHPDGLANSSGLVGKNLMVQSNQAVFGVMEDEVRWYKGPPSLTITEHWNYDDRKNFHGGYAWMAQGPLPIEWVGIQTSARGLWGQALRDEMEKYNHQVGLKMVGEMLPNEANRVTLDDETDQYGLRVARITYGWGENDKTMIAHGLDQMQTSLELVGAKELFRQTDDTNHLAGTARMGFDARDQRRELGLPKLGHSQPLGLRRLDLPDYRRGEPLADHHRHRHAHGQPDSRPGRQRRALAAVAPRPPEVCEPGVRP